MTRYIPLKSTSWKAQLADAQIHFLTLNPSWVAVCVAVENKVIL